MSAGRKEVDREENGFPAPSVDSRTEGRKQAAGSTATNPG